VSEVIPSWQRLNVPNAYSDEFLAAIRVAARNWRFEPARLVYWEKTGDEDLKYLYAVVVAARTDIKVTFATTEKNTDGPAKRAILRFSDPAGPLLCSSRG
jgi:hypothetical protein